MKQYEIKSRSAIFGVGMVLELTDKQAEARQDCLTRKGEYWVVSSPVAFKAGEIVGVVSGNVSKALAETLKEPEETSEEKPTQTTPEQAGVGGNEPATSEGSGTSELPATGDKEGGPDV
jgi:hypothetical protein